MFVCHFMYVKRFTFYKDLKTIMRAHINIKKQLGFMRLNCA
jgi:hypothetical protein